MANISAYLQAILAAVYGEQVRGSIHDAINIINEAMEVSISAGTAISGASSSSTGFFDNSLYINTNTYDLWKCIGTNSWSKIGNLRGNGITSIAKTGTSANVDTYTITFDDGGTETFTVTNGINGTNGSVWYKGTALTGTGTSITGFPGVINDFYLNSTTGYVYCCTKTGGAMVPDAAEWDYVMTLTGGGGGGGAILVIDNLTSASSTDALSANQGRVLKNLVDQKADASSLAQVATSGTYDDLDNKPVVDQTFDGTSENAQSGVAVEEGIDGSICRIVETTTVSASAGSTIIIPAPTESGGIITYNYDEHITHDSILIAISDAISNRPMKYSTVDRHVTLNSLGKEVGMVYIKIAEDIPANFNIGVLAINR